LWFYWFSTSLHFLQMKEAKLSYLPLYVAAKDGVAMNVDDKFLEVERRGSTNDEDLRSVYCCSAFMCLVFLVFLCCAVFFAFCWFFARYRLWAHQRPCGLKIICAFNCNINYDIDRNWFQLNGCVQDNIWKFEFIAIHWILTCSIQEFWRTWLMVIVFLMK